MFLKIPSQLSNVLEDPSQLSNVLVDFIQTQIIAAGLPLKIKSILKTKIT